MLWTPMFCCPPPSPPFLSCDPSVLAAPQSRKDNAFAVYSVWVILLERLLLREAFREGQI